MMIIGKKRIEMLKAAAPLMQWLEDNCHPHVTVIVDSYSIEACEGLARADRSELPVEPAEEVSHE